MPPLFCIHLSLPVMLKNPSLRAPSSPFTHSVTHSVARVGCSLSLTHAHSFIHASGPRPHELTHASCLTHTSHTPCLTHKAHPPCLTRKFTLLVSQTHISRSVSHTNLTLSVSLTPLTFPSLSHTQISPPCLCLIRTSHSHTHTSHPPSLTHASNSPCLTHASHRSPSLSHTSI